MTAAVLTVAAVSFLAFRGTLGHEFVSWDDDVYVYENPAFTNLSSARVAWLLSSFYYYAYIPVTLLSHTADVLVGGMDPRQHHLTNVLLHAANSAWVLLLGWVLLSRSGAVGPAGSARSRASAIAGMGIAAVLFAVHPLRAESVAWVSDRKDLLCAFFSLPAAIAYLVYSSRRGKARAGRWLAASFALFVLAILSKSTAVAFPLVLVILDWWRGRDGAGRLREKLPFVLVAAAIAALSLALAPHTTPSYSVSHISGVEWLLFPFYSLAFPLYKTLLPLHLSPIYPRVGSEGMWLGLAAVAIVTGGAALLARRGRRAPLAAWLVYLVFLLPNIAGLGSGAQPVADRYSYLSTISLYLLLGAGIAAAWGSGAVARRGAAAIGGGALIVLLLGLAIPQASQWRSSVSLWEFVVTTFPATRDYTDAYVNLGVAYEQAGRRADALRVLEKAFSTDPANAKVLHNLGMISYLDGNRQRALECFRRETEVDSHPAQAYFNRALAAESLGLHDEALASMVQAARLGSKDAQEALNSRGIPWERATP
ncbi:MAG TPA: tetratricopeptide repeat protein [Candidatus Eisenbacteria bacterium]|nr:tetratricopeptide repeat protein [Candidatus Eisenbacteria bacterium]